MRKPQKLLFAYLLIAAFFINGSVAVSAQTIDKKSFARKQRQAETIQAERLKDYLSYVASGEMEGRDTPSRGLDLTAKACRASPERMERKTGGRRRHLFSAHCSAEGNRQSGGNPCRILGGKTYQFGEDFLENGTAGTIKDAPLVYLRNGWILKAKDLNPYRTSDVRVKNRRYACQSAHRRNKRRFAR